MTAFPEHTLYYVMTGRTLSGPRQMGEVIDIDELAIRNMVTVLVDQRAVAPVPYGSTFVEANGITFVTQELADEYTDSIAGVVGEEEVVGSVDREVTAADYADNTVAELQEMLDTRSIEYAASLLKADLIDLLIADDDSNTESGEDEGEDAEESEGDTVQDVLDRIADLNKPEMAEQAESWGLTVDPEWTKADIMTHLEVHLSQ